MNTATGNSVVRRTKIEPPNPMTIASRGITPTIPAVASHSGRVELLIHLLQYAAVYR
jgi:hypothetical protein